MIQMFIATLLLSTRQATPAESGFHEVRFQSPDSAGQIPKSGSLFLFTSPDVSLSLLPSDSTYRAADGIYWKLNSKETNRLIAEDRSYRTESITRAMKKSSFTQVLDTDTVAGVEQDYLADSARINEALDSAHLNPKLLVGVRPLFTDTPLYRILAREATTLGASYLGDLAPNSDTGYSTKPLGTQTPLLRPLADEILRSSNLWYQFQESQKEVQNGSTQAKFAQDAYVRIHADDNLVAITGYTFNDSGEQIEMSAIGFHFGDSQAVVPKILKDQTWKIPASEWPLYQNGFCLPLSIDTKYPQPVPLAPEDLHKIEDPTPVDFFTLFLGDPIKALAHAMGDDKVNCLLGYNAFDSLTLPGVFHGTFIRLPEFYQALAQQYSVSSQNGVLTIKPLSLAQAMRSSIPFSKLARIVKALSIAQDDPLATLVNNLSGLGAVDINSTLSQSLIKIVWRNSPMHSKMTILPKSNSYGASLCHGNLDIASLTAIAMLQNSAHLDNKTSTKQFSLSTNNVGTRTTLRDLFYRADYNSGGKTTIYDHFTAFLRGTNPYLNATLNQSSGRLYYIKRGSELLQLPDPNESADAFDWVAKMLQTSDVLVEALPISSWQGSITGADGLLLFFSVRYSNSPLKEIQEAQLPPEILQKIGAATLPSPTPINQQD